MLGYIFVALAIIYFIWGIRVILGKHPWQGLGIIMLGITIWVRLTCDFFK